MAQAASLEQMGFFDPHMHFWNLGDAGSPHSDTRIGTKVPPLHSEDMYAAKWGEKTQCIHVEALPVKSGRDEVAWVKSQVTTETRLAACVAYADLRDPNIGQQLDELRATDQVAGIRQILNYSATEDFRTWPNVQGDYTVLDSWRRGLAMLGTDLSFDLQCNPLQIPSFAETVSPQQTVIIDHMGPPQIQSAAEEETWLRSMAALARLPNTHVKVSGMTHLFDHTRPWWQASHADHSHGLDLVHQVIRLFGAHRCMFASNAPVDPTFGLPTTESIALFHEIAQSYDEDSRTSLFQKTAKRAYKIE